MNDRLRIASEQLAALNNSAEWHPDAIVRGPFRWALMQADALIAAAAREPSPVKTGCDDCRERAEAAEARAADLQAKLDEAARLARETAGEAMHVAGGKTCVWVDDSSWAYSEPSCCDQAWSTAFAFKFCPHCGGEIVKGGE